VGIAETGSGKTLAYALPAIVHINGQRLLEPGEGPIVLVMVPTRELAVQIHKECDKFMASCQISAAAVYGGVDRASQQRALQRG
jgi:ATP-dependent RNA helicase DDX5/DBP2